MKNYVGVEQTRMKNMVFSSPKNSFEKPNIFFRERILIYGKGLIKSLPNRFGKDLIKPLPKIKMRSRKKVFGFSNEFFGDENTMFFIRVCSTPT